VVDSNCKVVGGSGITHHITLWELPLRMRDGAEAWKTANMGPTIGTVWYSGRTRRLRCI
jgi:hypothetical protein